MLMFLLMVAAQMQAADDNPAADWDCAEPLIEKNYNQEVPIEALARRIAEECVRPFSSTSERPDVIGAERMIFQTQASIFYLDVKSRIESRRLRDQIKLKR